MQNVYENPVARKEEEKGSQNADRTYMNIISEHPEAMSAGIQRTDRKRGEQKRRLYVIISQE